MSTAVDFVAASQPCEPSEEDEQWWEVLDEKTSKQLAEMTKHFPFELTWECKQLRESPCDDPLSLLLSTLLGAHGRQSGARLPWRKVPGARQLRRALQLCHGTVTDRNLASPEADGEQRYLVLAAAHSRLVLERDQLTAQHRDLLQEQCRDRSELAALKKCLREEVQRRQSAEERLKAIEFDLKDCQSECAAYQRQIQWLQDKHAASSISAAKPGALSSASRALAFSCDKACDRSVPRLLPDQLDALRMTCLYQRKRLTAQSVLLRSSEEPGGRSPCNRSDLMVGAYSGRGVSEDHVLGPSNLGLAEASELSRHSTSRPGSSAECLGPADAAPVIADVESVRCIRVRIISAHALRTPLSMIADPSGVRAAFPRPDPYVRLSVFSDALASSESRTTVALLSTSEPHWDQSFDFVLPENDEPCLHAQVLNYRSDAEHECLGWVTVSCAKQQRQSPIVMPLEGALSQGCLSFSIEFLPVDFAQSACPVGTTAHSQLTLVERTTGPRDALAKERFRCGPNLASSHQNERATQTELIAPYCSNCCGASEIAARKHAAVQTRPHGHSSPQQRLVPGSEASSSQELVPVGSGAECSTEVLGEEHGRELQCQEQLEDQLVRLALELANSVPRGQLEAVESRYAALEAQLYEERAQRGELPASVETAEALFRDPGYSVALSQLSNDSDCVEERRTVCPTAQRPSDEHFGGDVRNAMALPGGSRQHNRNNSAARCTATSEMVGSAALAPTVVGGTLAGADKCEQFCGPGTEGEIDSSFACDLDTSITNVAVHDSASVHFRVARRELFEIRKEWCASRNSRF